MIDKMNAVAKKLHIKSGQHWLFYNAPDNYLPLIEPLPDGVLADFAPIGNFDGIQLFVANNLQLIESLNVLAPFIEGRNGILDYLSQKELRYCIRFGNDG
jgi:hypothetical protein